MKCYECFSANRVRVTLNDSDEYINLIRKQRTTSKSLESIYCGILILYNKSQELLITDSIPKFKQTTTNPKHNETVCRFHRLYCTSNKLHHLSSSTYVICRAVTYWSRHTLFSAITYCYKWCQIAVTRYIWGCKEGIKSYCHQDKMIENFQTTFWNMCSS